MKIKERIAVICWVCNHRKSTDCCAFTFSENLFCNFFQLLSLYMHFSLLLASAGTFCRELLVKPSYRDPRSLLGEIPPKTTNNKTTNNKTTTTNNNKPTQNQLNPQAPRPSLCFWNLFCSLLTWDFPAIAWVWAILQSHLLCKIVLPKHDI